MTELPFPQSLWGIQSVQFPVIMATVLALFVLLLITRLVLRTYRIYMHPLSSFKGLTEACISENWLYTVTKDGTAEERFEALHQNFSMLEPRPYLRMYEGY